jgi:hypothetical protein
MNSRRLKLALAVVGILIFLAIVHYLASPLPPPKVSLRFEGFTQRGTNIFAVIRTQNDGQKIILWNDHTWEAHIETSAGTATNHADRSTTIPFGIMPTSNTFFYVSVPKDVTRWQVKATYDHFNRHHVRLELAYKLMASGRWNQMPDKVWEAWDGV